jgi:hypothetical protein
MMTKKRRNKRLVPAKHAPWKCWYCKTKYFPTYTEAREHANHCRAALNITAFFKEIFG